MKTFQCSIIERNVKVYRGQASSAEEAEEILQYQVPDPIHQYSLNFEEGEPGTKVG